MGMFRGVKRFGSAKPLLSSSGGAAYKFPEAADQDDWIKEKMVETDCSYKSTSCGREPGPVGWQVSQRGW
jgi:hypothetical protein